MNSWKIKRAGNSIANRRLQRVASPLLLSAVLAALIPIFETHYLPQNLNWWIWSLVSNVASVVLALLAVLTVVRAFFTFRKTEKIGLDISSILIVIGFLCIIACSMYTLNGLLSNGALERDAGMLYYNGYLVKQDYMRAEALLRSGYNKGNDWAGLYLADLYSDDANPRKNNTDAISLYSELVNSENTPVSEGAIRRLATHYLSNDSDSTSVEKGIEYASKLGDISDSDLDSELYNNLRLLLAKSILKEDPDYAARLYQAIVKAGDSSPQYGRALYSLAKMYDYGEGDVKQDYAKALDYYKRVIKCTNADAWDKSFASFYLSRLYMKGLGTEVDHAGAIQILTDALALTEDVDKRTDSEEEARGYVLLRLGDCYADSSWAEYDPAKALEAYTAAAALKRADYWVASMARRNTAVMYAEGSSVGKDVERAMDLLREALGFTRDGVSAGSDEAVARATVFATMGRLYWEQGWSGHSFAKAAECYYKAIKLDPDEKTYRESLAVLIEGGFGVARNPELAERVRSGQDFAIEEFE